MGEELKKLFHTQMLRDTDNPENAYNIIKDQTKILQENIDTLTSNIKKDIDKKIDDTFYKYRRNDREIKP